MSMSRMIDTTRLPQSLIEAIETIVRAYREHDAIAPAEGRKIGWAKDILPELPDTFFEPLPADALKLFEGEGEAA